MVCTVFYDTTLSSGVEVKWVGEIPYFKPCISLLNLGNNKSDSVELIILDNNLGTPVIKWLDGL